MDGSGQHISFTVISEGEEYIIQTCENEYRNLMVLLNDKIYIEDFGQCGGQGRCATCMVEVTAPNGALLTLERNEQSTIAKKGGATGNCRLSCQIFINSALNGAVINVLSDIY
ncbi:2Fe-2S iron-sulfur cluster-binding protein [Agriterribacter sp.]|uniref:2Fe-2S iron-sulfur cluster-binding protein n=1 Tax=Agriterribacter sp. TaxID=2821509 RepID=UPI002B537B0C|nr:2Fe-2S iron-sulfur cluster-binding protein [Agriterribacter sp.]HTN06703.1 2Fe-2S iron-sulfur cluster-binding protein [Agriterribacter sp.]